VVARHNRDITLRTELPLRAVTPGQSGVLYSAEGQVLGGGVIR
jgi:tRNA U34 2-thiouridine synthase MnmA/TrmU